VSGFVCKETDIDSLPAVLNLISEGKCYISPALAGRFLHLLCSCSYKNTQVNAPGKAPAKTPEDEEAQVFPEGDPAEYLTKTELRVLLEIGEGLNSGEVAKKLGLAVGSVRNCISSIMHKAGLNNRSQMVRYAISSGLVSMNPSYSAREKGK